MGKTRYRRRCYQSDGRRMVRCKDDDREPSAAVMTTIKSLTSKHLEVGQIIRVRARRADRDRSKRGFHPWTFGHDLPVALCNPKHFEGHAGRFFHYAQYVTIGIFCQARLI